MSIFSYALKSGPAKWVAGAFLGGVFFYFVPLFHFVSLKDARQQLAAGIFNAQDYVAAFWQGPLTDLRAQAVDAGTLLEALQEDRLEAAQQYGHRLGLSNKASYFVAGQGHIVAVEEDLVSISLEEGTPASIHVEMGPVFGNAIRDGSGLLSIGDFANTQEFNALSAEINRRVEEEVFPLLRAQGTVGKALRFAGGVELSDSGAVPESLTLVPVTIEFP